MAGARIFCLHLARTADKQRQRRRRQKVSFRVLRLLVATCAPVCPLPAPLSHSPYFLLHRPDCWQLAHTSPIPPSGRVCAEAIFLRRCNPRKKHAQNGQIGRRGRREQQRQAVGRGGMCCIVVSARMLHATTMRRLVCGMFNGD